MKVQRFTLNETGIYFVISGFRFETKVSESFGFSFGRIKFKYELILFLWTSTYLVYNVILTVPKERAIKKFTFIPKSSKNSVSR